MGTPDPLTFMAIVILFGVIVWAAALMIWVKDRRLTRQMLDTEPCTLPLGHYQEHDGMPRLEEVAEVRRRANPAKDQAHNERVKRYVSRETRRR